MQIDRQYAVGAAFTDHVGHHLGRDRHARGPCAPVLTGVAEVGNHRGDAAGRSALERIDHQQQFHDAVVGRCTGRLNDEDILAAHVLENLDIDLAIRKAAYGGVAERRLQVVGDVLRQDRIGVAAEQHQLTVGHFRISEAGIARGRQRLRVGMGKCVSRGTRYDFLTAHGSGALSDAGNIDHGAGNGWGGWIRTIA